MPKVSRVLETKLWEMYKDAFPPGSGFNKDFSRMEEFVELVRDMDCLKCYITNGGDILAYILATDNVSVISTFAKRDVTDLYKKAPPGKTVFWVFLFCQRRGNGNSFLLESKQLIVDFIDYTREHNGVIMFDQDPEKKFADKVSGIYRHTKRQPLEVSPIAQQETVMLNCGCN